MPKHADSHIVLLIIEPIRLSETASRSHSKFSVLTSTCARPTPRCVAIAHSTFAVQFGQF